MVIVVAVEKLVQVAEATRAILLGHPIRTFLLKRALFAIQSGVNSGHGRGNLLPK
jgi:hypothetical protein